MKTKVESIKSMLEETVKPQIFDTDKMGHINFLAPAIWFDRARTTIYQALSPHLVPEEIGVVILKTEMLYYKEMFWDLDVLVRTKVERIGNKSCTVAQEAWQNGVCCASGTVVLCGFDFVKRTSIPLSDRIKSVLYQFSDSNGVKNQ